MSLENSNYIFDIDLGKSIIIYNSSFEKDFKSCVNDLLQLSNIEFLNLKGPYRLIFDFIEDRIKITFYNKDNNFESILFSKTPFKRIIKDYSIIVESYNNKISVSSYSKVEAIDSGRRSVHNEGAEILSEVLSPSVKIDFETSRKIFFLLYILLR